MIKLESAIKNTYDPIFPTTRSSQSRSWISPPAIHFLKPVRMTSVEVEYDKHPEINREDITALQKWCEDRADLPDLNERDLIVFHHSCWFKIEDTKTCVENYFKIRSKNPTLFSNRDPQSESVRKAFDTTGFYLLDGLTPGGYRVLILRLLKTSPSVYNFNETLKAYTMVADAIFNTMGSSAGDLIVYDMTGTSFGHLPKLNVSGLKNILQYLQEGLPVRLKGVHIINAIPFVDILVNMMTPFMKKELLDMFHVSKTSDVLPTLMASSMLPQDYGGEGKSMEELREVTMQLVNSHRDFYIKDETRRLSTPTKSKPNDSSKITTSLRKLELD